jgi:hypothetical protein
MRMTKTVTAPVMTDDVVTVAAWMSHRSQGRSTRCPNCCNDKDSRCNRGSTSRAKRTPAAALIACAWRTADCRATASACRVRSSIARCFARSPMATALLSSSSSRASSAASASSSDLRYISKNGRLEMEDERGETMRGKDTLRGLADDWRFGGSLIEDTSGRREAFNIMLSMPRGIDPASVQWAAREFAKIELADHKYVMVLHDHQANPHVHISVRAESKHGHRLNPRKTDLHRWRETFAGKLQERGIEAEATRQATRGATRNHPELWRVKAAEDGRLRKPRAAHRPGAAATASRREARQAWQALAQALSKSAFASDRKLAASIAAFTRDQTTERHFTVGNAQPRHVLQLQPAPERGRSR